MDYVTIQMNDLTVRFPLVRRLLKQQRWPLLLCFLFRRIRGGRMRYFKLINWENFARTGGKKCLQLITVFRVLCLLSTAFCLLFGSFYSGHTIRREKSYWIKRWRRWFFARIQRKGNKFSVGHLDEVPRKPVCRFFSCRLTRASFQCFQNSIILFSGKWEFRE